MSLIARALQLVDFQRTQVTCKPKADVTHVTRIEKVTSVTSKNKHMSLWSIDSQIVMQPMQ